MKLVIDRFIFPKLCKIIVKIDIQSDLYRLIKPWVFDIEQNFLDRNCFHSVNME